MYVLTSQNMGNGNEKKIIISSTIVYKISEKMYVIEVHFKKIGAYFLYCRRKKYWRRRPIASGTIVKHMVRLKLRKGALTSISTLSLTCLTSVDNQNAVMPDEIFFF